METGRGRASPRATFSAPLKANLDLMGFHLSRIGAWFLSYKAEKRGQGQMGMGARKGRLTLLQEDK